MKHVGWLLVVLAAACLALAHRTRSAGAEATRSKAPPLSLEGLLDEKLPEAPKASPKGATKNAACYVCHGNYETEELVVSHAAEDIGCTDCHGQSVDHRNDEDNITPPDIMYPFDQIDKKCGECHAEHDASGREVVERWQQRCPQKTDPKEIVCTDCHYDHRLSTRVVQWDKKTRKLIMRTAGQQAGAVAQPKPKAGEKPPSRAPK
jgi:hypothetical protein